MLQNKCRCWKISSSLVNSKWYHLQKTIRFKSCGSSLDNLRSGPIRSRESSRGIFWWMKVALWQVFLLVLHCSSVSIISPLLHTDISFIYHRLWTSTIESTGNETLVHFSLLPWTHVSTMRKLCDIASNWTDCYDSFMMFSIWFWRAPRRKFLQGE